MQIILELGNKTAYCKHWTGLWTLNFGLWTFGFEIVLFLRFSYNYIKI